MLIGTNENHHNSKQTNATKEFAEEVSKRYGLKEYEFRWITACPFIHFKKDGKIIFEVGYWLEGRNGYSLAKCIRPLYYQNILTDAKKEKVFEEIDKLLEVSTKKKITQLSLFDI